MKSFRPLSVFYLSIFLVLGYVFLDKNVLSALTDWRTVSVETYHYDLESLRQTFKYSAENIFNSGYVREVEADLYKRLALYPGNQRLPEGQVVFAPKEEGVVSLVLPEGFEEGLLSLRVATKANFTIGASPDLKNWDFKDYPGFPELTYYVFPLKAKDLKGDLYLRFISSGGEQMELSFNILQYLSTRPKAENNDYGILFFPEVDVDFEGKDVPMLGVLYDKRLAK